MSLLKEMIICKNVTNMVGIYGQMQEGARVAFKTAAMAGFVTTATLFIGFNYKTFNRLFLKKNFIYWSLFCAFSVIPLLVVIYFFNLLFAGTAIAF